ncbi:hypothetical protein [Clostridium tetani]|uniref:hypothetical protein n=1 Tax=Clostridium tetani TaxID=1513 RepID=UPI00100A9E25|nr:hypothetical protein [Clostridium tetani]RXM74759.1 hypothetical protein DP143_00175 [Clostridium tetani]
MENLENNEIIDQEIDYKAEYEKMKAEKEREKAINGFKGAVSNKGYVINEELFSTMCKEYDNKTLEGFSKIINAVEQKPPKFSGVTPVAGDSIPTKKEVQKVTFNDYVSNK